MISNPSIMAMKERMNKIPKRGGKGGGYLLPTGQPVSNYVFLKYLQFLPAYAVTCRVDR